MANYITVKANAREEWSTKYTQEYVRESGFMPYMGTDDSSIIRVNKELTGKGGVALHLPYFAKLSGAGVTGGTTLMGAEDTLNNYSTTINTLMFRNGVSIPESETIKTELDIANVARGSLKSWSAEKLRTDLITAAASIIIPGGSDGNGGQLTDTYVAYGSASAGQRNAHLVANADRTLFGNLNGNAVSGVFATALATITPSQKLSAGVLAMAKTLAKKSAPFKINPYRSDATAGRDYYVLFVNSEGFRDLSLDTTILSANTNARARDVESNPLFQSGDLIHGGIVIREIPEIPSLGNVGSGGTTTVGQAFLCGVNALGIGYSMLPTPRLQDWDYGMLHNLAIVEARGQAKMSAAGVQTGMVSIYHAASPDA